MNRIKQNRTCFSVKSFIRGVITFLALTSLVSCASTTTIRAIDSKDSVDKNVKIYLDGQYKGKGEVTHSDTKIIGATTLISLKKENCKTVNHTLARSERLQVGPLIAGIFFLVPLLWIMGYNPLHSYEYSCN